jgi:hypothetical protein
LYLVGLSTHR